MYLCVHKCVPKQMHACAYLCMHAHVGFVGLAEVQVARLKSLIESGAVLRSSSGDCRGEELSSPETDPVLGWVSPKSNGMGEGRLGDRTRGGAELVLSESSLGGPACAPEDALDSPQGVCIW